jgi:ComF family protein
VAGTCAECGERAFAFCAARCAALLEPPVSRAVVVLKDAGERRYAAVLAGLLVSAATDWLRADDVLVPVPASPQALRRRGFDHAADIAQELGRSTGLPVVRALRTTRTADQRSLGRADRFANRAGAFCVSPGVPPPRWVVLVDDVFTTGATLDAAARVLHAAGVTEVRALAVARSCRAGPAPVQSP